MRTTLQMVTTVLGILGAASLIAVEVSTAADTDGPSGKQKASTPVQLEYGDGFLPHSATVYERAAMDHALLLKYYAESGASIPAEVVKEHLAEIERNLAAAKKAYSKLGKPLDSRDDLMVHVTAVKGSLQSCEEHCAKMSKDLEAKTQEAKDSATHAAQIYKQLKEAQQEHYQIMRKLGVRENYYPPRMNPYGPSYDPENLNPK